MPLISRYVCVLSAVCLASAVLFASPQQAEAIICIAAAGEGTAACEAGTDGYSQVGLNGGASNWVIQESSSLAVQGAASGSSLFVTPVPTGGEAVIDTKAWDGKPPNGEAWSLMPEEISFTITARRSANDNFIGFALGAEADQQTPFLLYDWHRSNTNPAPIGSRLTLIEGTQVSYLSMNGDDATVLGRGRSHGNNPWSTNHVNDVTIAFGATHLSIKVQVIGTLITGEEFEIAYADLPPGTLDGNLAFYTRSQSNVHFGVADFKTLFSETEPRPEPSRSAKVDAPSGLAGMGLLCLALAVLARRHPRA